MRKSTSKLKFDCRLFSAALKSPFSAQHHRKMQSLTEKCNSLKQLELGIEFIRSLRYHGERSVIVFVIK